MNEDYGLYFRRGHFTLLLSYLHNEPDEIMLIMSKMIIYRCEMMYINNFHYSAISPLFDKLSDGEEAPWYEVNVEDGEVLTKRVTGRQSG